MKQADEALQISSQDRDGKEGSCWLVTSQGAEREKEREREEKNLPSFSPRPDHLGLGQWKGMGRPQPQPPLSSWIASARSPSRWMPGASLGN